VRLTPRTRDLFELCVGYGLILATVWTPNPAQRILYWTAFAWIAVTAILRRKEVATHGLGLSGLVPSLWIVGAAILIALAGIALAQHLHTLHPLYGPLPVITHLGDTRSGRSCSSSFCRSTSSRDSCASACVRNSAIALATLLFASSPHPQPAAGRTHLNMGSHLVRTLPALSQPLHAGARAWDPRHVPGGHGSQ
jgi:hypothetical protein